MKLFTADNRRLNSAYGFDFLYAPDLTATVVRDALESWADDATIGWPSWAFENHDAPRAISRWTRSGDRAAFLRLKMLLLACLRGNIFLYYGEELGLPQVDIAYEDLRDPEAIANWPLTLSRDGARTPMPWRADAPHLGFTTDKPWLPLGPEHRVLAVDRQEADPASILHYTRAILKTRNASPALRHGSIAFLDAADGLLAFERVAGDERILCVFNLGDATAGFAITDPARWERIAHAGEVDDGKFAPFAGTVMRWRGA